jgi:hypothetical protein
VLNLGLLGFTQPWLLAAFVALPALWLLLRLTPPAPRRLAFPALFLLRLETPEETPARTPWWLLLLRLVIAALLILALAGPLLNPQPRLAGDGPLLLVVDDGWASAAHWDDRIRSLEELLSQADREDREAAILRTAPDQQGMRVARGPARAILEALPGWSPKPWPVERTQAAEALGQAGLESAGTVWLSDGLAGSEEERQAASALADELRRLGPVRIMAEPPAERPPLLLPPENTTEGLALRIARADAGAAQAAEVRAVGPGGEVLGRTRLDFGQDQTEGEAPLDLPLELRNRISRLELVPQTHAGSVVLFDERWRRRTVGLYGAHHAAASQPLLGDLYFIQRALAPYAEIREGPVTELLETPLSLIAIADVGRLGDEERRQLEGWMEGGGVVLRFAGPRLAAGDDPLIPVPLRQGDRQLGGALSWAQPLPLAPFAPNSPFAGLRVGEEARVSRQVLAQPGPDLANSVLASLSDGTPIVTGKRVGQGWLILFHTTANTAWSSLPLSGLFVDMLHRILALAPGAGEQVQGMLVADAVLDGFGRLSDPPAGLQPVEAGSLTRLTPGPHARPGLYAPADAGTDRSDVARFALNLQQGIERLLPLDTRAFGTVPETYQRASEVDLAPWLLLVAFLLLLADLMIGYAFRGLLPALRGAAAGAVAIVLLPGSIGWTQEPGDDSIRELTDQTHLGYVRTGIGEIDEISRAGLVGLGEVLEQRTSIETGEPVAIDPAEDDLALFPLLYWPVPPDHPDLSETARDHLREYLRTGGMIMFDTKDAGVLLPGQAGGGPGERRLSELLAGIDLPPLMVMPEDHVLTRSFYLLQDFPGRFAGQQVWVEQASAGVNDGVAGIVIGGNDWAGAWAVDDGGQSMLPVDPGGEAQREMARRFGVNLAMYALTGNYKTDQVHVPALLERLGQ